jgi:hypothetical protein
MTAGSSFTNAFGGVAIRPAQPSYLALSIATNTALVWPLETTEGQPVVATQLDITATAMSLQLQMPSGSTGSTGVQSIISNVGTNTFTVTDQSGNQIAVIATTQTWLITLTNNTTANGVWRAVQIGSTVSQAVAAALAGYGLQAVGSQLQINWPVTEVSSTGTVGASARSTVLDWTGATGTLQLGASATLGDGWVCAFRNDGTGPVTFTCSGSDEINGASSLQVLPLLSGFIFCTGDGFITVGAQLGVLPIFAGGTGANNANGALTNLGGTSVGISIFTAPTTTAVVALLGLSGVNIAESTISTDQTLAPSSTNTAFVCTAGLTLTLPLTTSLTNRFSFLVFAEGGDVILSPQASDAIQGGSAAADFTIPEGSSAFVFTDANGAWWLLFLSLPIGGGTLTGALTIESGGLTVTAGGATITAGGFVVTAGGVMIDAGGLGVSGGGAINGGLAVAGGLDVTGNSTITGSLLVSLPGTTGNEAVNFSQFANTLTVVGSQDLPGGLVEQWGTGATVSGVGTISFASPFATACLNVQLTITGASGTISVHPLALGALAAAGVPVYGDASESLTFNYLALGH